MATLHDTSTLAIPPPSPNDSTVELRPCKAPARQSFTSDTVIESDLYQTATKESTKSFHHIELPKGQFILVLIGVSLAMFLSALDQTIVATALPVIASEFNSLDKVSWVVTSYLLTATAFQPMYGRFSDIFGRRAAILFAVGTFLIGSAMCGAAQSIHMLVGARLVAGLGAGGIFSCVLIILADLSPLEKRAKYGSIIGAVFAASYVLGPLVGGAFTDKVSWRWGFWINLPLGAITVIVVVLYLSIPTPVGNVWSKVKRVDFVGVTLMISFLVCLMLAFSWAGDDYEWTSGIIIGLFVASGVLLCSFIVYESWTEDAIIPPRLFTIRNMALNFAISFLINQVYIATLYYLPYYFQVIRGDTAISSGLKTLPLLFTIPVFVFIAAYLSERLGIINLWTQIGTFFLTVGLALLSTLSVSSTIAQEMVYMLLVGIGLGNTIQNTIIGAQAATPVRDLAVVSGILAFSTNIGSIVGMIVCGAIFNNTVEDELVKRLAGLEGMTPDIIQGIKQSVPVLYSQPHAIQVLSKEAFMVAFKLVFLILIPFVGLAFLLSLLLANTKNTKEKQPLVVA